MAPGGTTFRDTERSCLSSPRRRGRLLPAMRVSRIETVIQFVSDQQASSRWYAQLLGMEPTPYGAPYFKFDEHAYLILAPGISCPRVRRRSTFLSHL